MKKLLITMLAILAFNVSYANGSMGEEVGNPGCSKTRGDASRDVYSSTDILPSDTSSSNGSSVIGG